LFETSTYNPPSFSDTCHLFTRHEKKRDGKKRDGKKRKETRSPALTYISSSGVPFTFPPRPARLLFTEQSSPVLGFSFGLLIWTPRLADGGGIEELTIDAAPLVSLEHFALRFVSLDSYYCVCGAFGSIFVFCDVLV
jgi:hypothetical protein